MDRSSRSRSSSSERMEPMVSVRSKLSPESRLDKNAEPDVLEEFVYSLPDSSNVVFFFRIDGGAVVDEEEETTDANVAVR